MTEPPASKLTGTKTAIVLTGGAGAPSVPPAEAREAIDAGAVVVAADSGLHLARRWGWSVALVVGDLDSVDPGALAAAESEGAEVQRHPVAKDWSDLELAMLAAVGDSATRLLVVGGAEGRSDHALANLMVLGSEEFAALRVEAVLGETRVWVVRSGVTAHIEGSPGDLVTLLAVHGAAVGVRTRGLLYPLDGETLSAGSSRGLSNELTEREATVSVTGGVLLALRLFGAVTGGGDGV